VDSWYITQSAQNYSGSVPLVANRDGYLRVFVRANQANTNTAPTVRITINGTHTDVLASSSSVPTSIVEGNPNASWNLAVPGSSISPGMTVGIQIDPTLSIPEADRTNNTINATPTVDAVKDFNCVIVPVFQSQNGLAGNVDSGRTLGSWVDRFQRMYPIKNGGINITKGSTYTYTGTPLTSAGTNWETLLGDIDAKRTAEGSSSYYFGAVNVSYSNGVAGYASVGSPAAIGWDKTGYYDGGNYPEIYAHEVGHNLGRYHSPCGNPPGVDANYPYSTGSIGTWGWDEGYASALAPLNTSPWRDPATYKDIMSYCTPLWVSDYTYQGIMTFRAGSAIGDVVNVSPNQQDCLLVSGQVKNGQMTLNPAFKVRTISQLPEPGSHTLQLHDAQGHTLAEVSFDPVEIADMPGDPVQYFVFAIPLDSTVETDLAGLRVVKEGSTKAMMAPTMAAAKMVGVREPVSVRMRPGQAHLSWDPMVHPKVMVRDPRTGEVISFADGGSLDLETDATDLDVTFSDGVHSTRKFMKVQ
jgi:hypothetical protein